MDPNFVQKAECTGILVLTALQKAVATIRILAYGVPGMRWMSTFESVRVLYIRTLSTSARL